MKLSVHKIENSVVLCENIDTMEKHIFPIQNMPKGIKENDIIVNNNNTFHIDTDETAKKKEKFKNMLDSLFN